MQQDRVSAMGLLTFALNVTLDGCCGHREMVADDEMLRYWTRVMDAAGAMLFGRHTYEMMEDGWPQVARDPKATPANRNWAKKLEAKPKYVVSTTRRDFPVEQHASRRRRPDRGGDGVEGGHAARTAGG
jgi:dihydrofolate reductase